MFHLESKYKRKATDIASHLNILYFKTFNYTRKNSKFDYFFLIEN